MAVNSVVFVHGYSVRTLSAYSMFPKFINDRGIQSQNVLLSAFFSLDDKISCEDLAIALEDHVQTLGAALDLRHTAVVCHSTGAIVARRWILNRAAAGLELPSHFVSIAGANHGSTMAQVGRTIIASLFRHAIQQSSVGARVLEDLDYGSAYLLKLNREWLEASNAGALGTLYSFSMGGDDHSDLMNEIIWQSRENGSDGTVRISGANLNYSFVVADPTNTPSMKLIMPTRPAPHLVIKHYSHTGGKGIIDSVRVPTEEPFQALVDALNVNDEQGYTALAQAWAGRTNQWIVDCAGQVKSTLVFSLRDTSGGTIDDSLIILKDPAQDAKAVTPSLELHQPIQNQQSPSSVSFYVDYQAFMGSHPHTIHIEARSGSNAVDYKDVDYPVPDGIAAMVRPNEFTYVDVTLDRDVTNAYRFYEYSATLPLDKAWPPFP